jgi:hypothetical protein
MNALDFTTGMTVTDRNGIELGQVIEVWADTPHGPLGASRYLLSSYGPIGGNEHLFNTGSAYLQVRQGEFLGAGGRDLFVPLHAIHTRDGFGRVTVRHAAEVCERSFVAMQTALEMAA